MGIGRQTRLDFPRLRMPANAQIRVAGATSPILPHVQEPDPNDVFPGRRLSRFATVFAPRQTTKITALQRLARPTVFPSQINGENGPKRSKTVENGQRIRTTPRKAMSSMPS